MRTDYLNVKNIGDFFDMIKSIFTDLRAEWPEVKDENLYGGGAIYYQNANDGTDFDWKCNGHLCEFGLFHKESTLYCFKMHVHRGGGIEVYSYPHEEAHSVKEYKFNTNPEVVRKAFKWLLEHADDKHLWDRSLDELDVPTNDMSL